MNYDKAKLGVGDKYQSRDHELVHHGVVRVSALTFALEAGFG